MLAKIFTTVAIAASLVTAQTHTDCDPTKRGMFTQRNLSLGVR